MAHEDSIIEDFRAAMREQGIPVSEKLIADGKFHRAHVDGDGKKSRNGWYVLHLDGTPGGAYGCNKRYGNDAKFTWAGKSSTPLTPEERLAFRRRMEAQRAEREAEKLRLSEAAAQHAAFMWDQAADADEHPYLTRKGVKAHGVRVGAWEKIDHDNGEVITVCADALLIPIRDTAKRLRSMQAIYPQKRGDRDKDYLKDGVKEGNFFAIGKPKTIEHAGRQRMVIMVGEGYATVASAHEATGHAGIVAFDAPNLVPVVKALHAKFPDALFVMLADNDQWTVPTPEHPHIVENPGLTRAREAAKLVDGAVALPPFAHDEARPDEDGKLRGPTDFNDLQQLRGADAVRLAIDVAINPPPAPAEPPPPDAPPEDVAPWDGDDELAAPLPAPVADDGRPEANGYFTILGYNRGTYYVFQHGKRQIAEITKGDLGEVGLIELAPLNWWEQNFPGDRSKIDTKMAAEFIIRTAEQRGIFDTEKIRGRGAWIDDGRVVYHHGSHLSVAGQPVDVTKIKSNFVYELAKSMQLPADEPMSDEEGKRLVEVMKMFRWSIDGSALLFAGWVALAPVCGAIPWRPHVWMTGGAGSGKSSLAKFGHALLKGTDVFAQGNSSEAGIRQRLRADARPVIMDESESNEEGDAKRIQSVLGLIRQASTESDAETLKGTTDGSGMTYHIRSMFCLASIQVALKHKADIDRLTVLTLRSGKSGDQQSGSEWAKIKDAMYQLAERDSTFRARLLRRCIDLLPVTLQNIEVFSSAGAEVFGSQRDGDQYGALLAGAWSLVSMKVATREQAKKMFGSYNWQELRDDHDSDESHGALAALMEAHVRVKGGIELTVYELVRAASGQETGLTEINEMTADAILQRYGMKVKDSSLVLSNRSTELRRLMSGTTFEADYRGVLLRVDGADKNANKPERFNGVQTKCFRIPLAAIDIVARSKQEAAF